MNDVSAPSTNELAQVKTKLEELAARANEAHQRVFKAAGQGLLAAFEAGQSLLEARKACLGHFMTWLPDNFKASTRTAQRYMVFAQECLSIGGFDATRVSRLTPHELGRIWSDILGRRSGKKTRLLPAAADEPASSATSLVPAECDAAEPIANATTPAPAVERLAAPVSEACASLADPMPPLVAQFADLIEGFRRVCAGDDCHDGPYAEWMVMDLEPQYADLLEYMEYRQEWRSQPGYTGVSSP